MTDPGNRKGVNVPLLIGLALVGLVFLTLWTQGCVAGTFGFRRWWPWGGHAWPWDPTSWRTGLFGPLYPLFGIWGLIQVALALWVGVDANRRGINGVLWGLLVLFTSVVGLIVYLLVAPTLESQRNGRAAGAGAAEPPPAAPAPAPAPDCCGRCGTPLRADFRACPECGTPTQSACRECDRPLEPGWKVCPFCGTAAAAPPATPGG